MGYVVNEDKPTNSALVHDETCEHYSDRLPKAPQDGGWHGPYESEDEALAKARATGRSDVRVAKCCLAEPGILDRAKGAIGSVTQRARRSAEVISGGRHPPFRGIHGCNYHGRHRRTSRPSRATRATCRSGAISRRPAAASSQGGGKPDALGHRIRDSSCGSATR